jgi:hypothetical protein
MNAAPVVALAIVYLLQLARNLYDISPVLSSCYICRSFHESVFTPLGVGAISLPKSAASWQNSVPQKPLVIFASMKASWCSE